MHLLWRLYLKSRVGKKIVFDGIARPRDVRAFESLDRSDEFMLDVERQTGGYAVRVDLVSVETLGLDENLMRRLVREAHDFVFHRRAIARADALDQSGEHRRALAGGANDVVGSLVGGRDVAGHLAGMARTSYPKMRTPAAVRRCAVLLTSLSRSMLLPSVARRRARLQAADANGSSRSRAANLIDGASPARPPA